MNEKKDEVIEAKIHQDIEKQEAARQVNDDPPQDDVSLHDAKEIEEQHDIHVLVDQPDDNDNDSDSCSCSTCIDSDSEEEENKENLSVQEPEAGIDDSVCDCSECTEEILEDGVILDIDNAEKTPHPAQSSSVWFQKHRNLLILLLILSLVGGLSVSLLWFSDVLYYDTIDTTGVISSAVIVRSYTDTTAAQVKTTLDDFLLEDVDTESSVSVAISYDGNTVHYLYTAKGKSESLMQWDTKIQQYDSAMISIYNLNSGSISMFSDITAAPTVSPTQAPTATPTAAVPTASPTAAPTTAPTATPSTAVPTASPTGSPSPTPDLTNWDDLTDSFIAYPDYSELDVALRIYITEPIYVNDHVYLNVDLRDDLMFGNIYSIRYQTDTLEAYQEDDILSIYFVSKNNLTDRVQPYITLTSTTASTSYEGLVENAWAFVQR